MDQHRCGGNLKPATLKIAKKVGTLHQTFTVDGFKCDKCGEEVISRDTAYEIDKAIERLKRQWSPWRIPAGTKKTTAPISNSSEISAVWFVHQDDKIPTEKI